jgi:hypothetical protein
MFKIIKGRYQVTGWTFLMKITSGKKYHPSVPLPLSVFVLTRDKEILAAPVAVCLGWLGRILKLCS